MEQVLDGEIEYAAIKAAPESIGLIKMLEFICYNYQSHEYPPLGAWEALDRLSDTKQPEYVSELDHHEKSKAMVEVCKASGINFALMCTHNIDAAMKKLSKDGSISVSGTYADRTYSGFSEVHTKLVNGVAEEICMLTRFLSLSNDALH